MIIASHRPSIKAIGRASARTHSQFLPTGESPLTHFGCILLAFCSAYCRIALLLFGLFAFPTQVNGSALLILALVLGPLNAFLTRRNSPLTVPFSCGFLPGGCFRFFFLYCSSFVFTFVVHHLVDVFCCFVVVTSCLRCVCVCPVFVD